MTHTSPLRLPSTAGQKRRNKSPGEVEFTALFQLLPGPALLVDKTQETILLANSPFLKLTAFAINEISGRALRSMVSELPSHPLAGDEVFSVLIDRRNR